MRNQFIAQFVVLSLQQSTYGTARCLDGRVLFCAPISLQMTTKRELRPFWLKFGPKGFEEWIFRDVASSNGL